MPVFVREDGVDDDDTIWVDVKFVKESEQSFALD